LIRFIFYSTVGYFMVKWLITPFLGLYYQLVWGDYITLLTNDRGRRPSCHIGSEGHFGL